MQVKSATQTHPQSPSQTKSRERIKDHGEVYTNEREVNAMLDLVAHQCTDPEATFLEPACGTGNFLAVILQRKLTAIYQKHKKIQYNYELNAITAISSIYGIELLADNVAECRERLLAIFQNHYSSHFKNINPRCIDVARFLLSKNILCGDALSLKQKDGTPIVFSEWSMLGTDMIRREYVYPDLINKSSERELPLFSDLGDDAYIPEPIKEYPPVYFLDIDLSDKEYKK
ncbi:restriction endonuclease subunit M [Moraxella nasovis]|uniref:DNA methyltransferase n=1 Tax=Moraxella nasovis TaxID=2904121 RepID=UPI001F61B464|nr:DNA methyltransferase [Moraxella nasovis]UNU74252.1 restriction endonuclease subunit M [Moraxella nasovis]